MRSLEEKLANHLMMSRREFLKLGVAGGLGLAGLASANFSGEISFGIVADVHYADKDMRINRYYREALTKLHECVTTFNHTRPAFAVMLGDFIDKAPDRATELQYLQTIRQVFSQYAGDKHFVLGNHDLARLSKTEYLENCGARSPHSYYSFNAAGHHFVILDANYRQDGTPYEAGNFKWVDSCLDTAQQEWLAQDLENAKGMKTVVFVHQNLHDETSPYGVKNARAVRRILEKSGKVLAVIQGHDHQGGYEKINGIHYVNLKALVEGPTLKNNSYAIVTIAKNGRLSWRGFGRESDRIFA
ncbi:MAG: metallophosphoesterase [candidate division KSB1 bacterium]|nr:metallophosphoesterase [candidate division KSB1 bacterium]MDZ7365688.1 metallophosphoesterase [candidate division KSB1 bacterium]MDZ7403236.1 metallophosphoesterase [candidate division KSB1 bacterium]